jgi:uroporphyrinogen decarboxylase
VKPLSRGRARLAAVSEGAWLQRPPVSFWRHFYTEENDSEALAAALLGFHREFGWDWIKLNPRASYLLEDWGFLYEASTHPHAKPAKKHFPVQTSADWQRITPKPATAGALGEHLELIARVVQAAGGDPVLMTVFTPLSVAGDLVPDDGMLLRHLQDHPQAVAGALDAITETLETFAVEALNAGADGLFFATTQWASRDLLSAEAYARWGRPYDLRVLQRVQQAPFNVLHVCGQRSLLGELKDYPVTFLNWGFADADNPDLALGHKLCGKPVIGGVARHHDLLNATPEGVYQSVCRQAALMQGLPWVCGPDCAIETQTGTDHLKAVSAALNTLEERSPSHAV